MLIEISDAQFKEYFPEDPHPFVSNTFIKHNIGKVDRVIWLVDDAEKPEIGLVAGLRGNALLSPFSAPFGGFHFKKENIYSDTVDVFMASLKAYLTANNIKEFGITLPPNLYHQTFNAKCVSSFLRAGFKQSLPEITSHVNLLDFNDRFKQKNSREYYGQAVRNGLVFQSTTDDSDKVQIFELIRDNRAKFGRPIFMTLDNIKAMDALWPVDFFKVTTADHSIAASGIFYRFHPEIVYAVFWGDNELGRPLRAMDFLIFNLWSHYKKLGYQTIDLGMSTEAGVPNNGLLRFKETHEAESSLRFRFSLLQ